MKPLGEVIRRCGLRNHQYADDTQLYLSFSTNPGEAVAVLNQCLAEVMGWMRANKLKLNPDKTEVLLVGGSGFREGELNLVLNGVALPLRDKVRSLGVLLDPELSLEAQVTEVARSAFLQLRLIHQLRPYLEYDCLATVTHALVTSRLDFCNAVYVGLPLKTVRILQLVQNRAARLLPGTGRYVHMTPVLRQLHWLPIEVRAQFKVLVMSYKALNGLGPGYLKERLHPYVPDRPLRSAGEALLREPSVKEIRRKYRLEVGIQAMSPLIQVLQTDRSDSEIIGYALDTLYNIISNELEEEEQEENVQKPAEDLGSQFTEIFIKQQENVTLLLSYLEEFDFHVRWPGVKLLTVLLKQQGPQMQQIILVSPMGVSRLMDLLVDSREVIRYDVVLLLQQLTKSNAAIQKIVAFENAFERLLDIITDEGNSDGGIVVEDCLLLLQNLLKNNNSNQNFFKEGSYIQRMKPWFEVGDDNAGWSAQKVTNLHLMLQLVRVLVSPTNPPGATSSCQKAMFHCGLLQQLCTILMATGVPADILTEMATLVSPQKPLNY
ncbi:hypothetical protein EYD10_14250 [Varanus komodoensis]|nr:hypothetical protein EYD10_14250 [Varanus komodoensis]